MPETNTTQLSGSNLSGAITQELIGTPFHPLLRTGNIAVAGTVSLRSVYGPFSKAAVQHEEPPQYNLDELGHLDAIEQAKLIYDEIETIFNDPIRRPEPETIQSLILAGATEEDFISVWQSQGHEVPKMELTFADLQGALPYVGALTERLAASHNKGERMLFAGRDADLLYDYFTISNPEISTDLLPASGTLWYSSGMQNNALARRFLSNHQLDERSVRDPDSRYKIVDTGFEGTIMNQVIKGLKQTYGKRTINPDKFSIEMVCANDRAIGTQIMQFPGAADEIQAKFPKVTACLGPAISRFFGRNTSSTIPLAVSLQLMPRYHGPYENIEEIGDQVVAIPKIKAYSENVDTPLHVTAADSTIINPLAAALVQYRVVNYAMRNRTAHGSLAYTHKQPELLPV